MESIFIEAESYRAGANGVTYADYSSGNSGGALRGDDVDIQVSEEGGHNVGWIESGEWLTYDISVPEDGVYQLTARVAAEFASGRLKASIGGQETIVSFDPTGGWQTWTSENGDATLNLSAGSHVLQIDMLSSDFNLNWLELEKVGASPDPEPEPTPDPEPQPEPALMRIEVESYRAGANGVTYADYSSGNSGGALRGDDVDIQVSEEGGHNVGWIESGEWLTYDISVPEDGVYQLTARVAAEFASGRLKASIGGQETIVSFDPTGGWQTWTSENGDATLNLSAGSHVLQIDMLSSDFNLNWLELEKVGASPDPAPEPTPDPEPQPEPALMRIEVESYRAGANGVTYADYSSGNSGGALRGDDVDIQVSEEGGHNVGWIESGEWLTYDISVPEDGVYQLTARVAAEFASGRLKASIGGQETIVSFDPTGGWQTWTSENGDATLNLSAGSHVLQIDMLSSDFNLNWLELEKVGQSPEPPPAPDPEPPSQPNLNLSQYDLLWSDEFEGGAGDRPAPHWYFFDGYGSGTWRDATYTEEDAYLDGAGNLVLRARYEDDALKTSYLQTYDWSVPESQWTTFGPGDGKYIEASLRLNELEAGGLFSSFWLFDPSDTYDGDPSTGTEIDIFEYPLSAGKETSWTKHLPNGTYNHYMASNHWGQTENSYIDAADFRIDLRDGEYHTVGLEWTAEELTYYLDGFEVWSTKNGVSLSDDQAIKFSIEYDQGPGDVWGLDEDIRDYLDILPDYFIIDYVRVYEKKPSDGPVDDVPTPDDQPNGRGAVPIILDTDFGGDVDDAAALAVLNQLQKNGEAAVLAIGSSSWDRDAVAGIDAINEYYGHGDIPIGRHFAGIRTDGSGGYAEALAAQFYHDQDGSTAPSTTELYRQTLAAQPNDSVSFVTVGTLQNIMDLLESGPDQYSSLSGAELFNQKVQSVHIMGGKYPESDGGAEWNFAGAGNGVARSVVESIDKPIVFNGFKIGHMGAGYGAGDVLNGEPLSNPVVAAYHHFFSVNPPDWVNGGVPSSEIIDWSTWDPIAVLTAVRGSGSYFDEVSNGRNDIADSGHNTWRSNPDRDHSYLTPEMDPETFAETILEPLFLLQ